MGAVAIIAAVLLFVTILFMRDMEEDIREAEAAVAKQIANEKMMHRKTLPPPVN